jgi:hypothetical protein
LAEGATEADPAKERPPSKSHQNVPQFSSHSRQNSSSVHSLQTTRGRGNCFVRNTANFAAWDLSSHELSACFSFYSYLACLDSISCIRARAVLFIHLVGGGDFAWVLMVMVVRSLVCNIVICAISCKFGCYYAMLYVGGSVRLAGLAVLCPGRRSANLWPTCIYAQACKLY